MPLWPSPKHLPAVLAVASMQRRAVLAGLGCATVPLAGCLGGTDDGGTPTDSPADAPALPEDCPKTQDLDVEWPEDLDRETVEPFVEEYEHRYYRDVVVGFERESRLDADRLRAPVTEGPAPRGDGYELKVSGRGALFTPNLRLVAEASEAPDGAEVVPLGEIDDVILREALIEAAEDGDAEFHVRSPQAEVERYLELLESVSEEFDPPSEPGDSGSLYVDVDGTTVELTAKATFFHGDYGWTAWYYVDAHVVRRTTDGTIDAQDGTVLECRRAE